MDTHYPFAENAQIVEMIGRDLLWAIWAVPALFLAAWGAYSTAKAGQWGRCVRWMFNGVAAIGWAAFFLLHWVVPKPITLDLADLRAATADPAIFAKGKLGYFDCAIRFTPTASVPWSARKLIAFRGADGERLLWVEGNADDPAIVEQQLRDASKVLRITPVPADLIERQIERHRDNTQPMFAQDVLNYPGRVLIFREPNGLATPCLALRY